MSSLTDHPLELSEEAQDDIDQIHLYTLMTWGEAQMEVYAGLLDKALSAIAKDPATGRSRDGFPRNIRSYRAGKHVIFYRVEKKNVYVLRVLHRSMDFASHL